MSGKPRPPNPGFQNPRSRRVSDFGIALSDLGTLSCLFINLLALFFIKNAGQMPEILNFESGFSRPASGAGTRNCYRARARHAGTARSGLLRLDAALWFSPIMLYPLCGLAALLPADLIEPSFPRGATEERSAKCQPATQGRGQRPSGGCDQQPGTAGERPPAQTDPWSCVAHPTRCLTQCGPTEVPARRCYNPPMPVRLA